MNWSVLDTGKASASENMAIDAALLKNSPKEPILHFYEWAHPYSLTFGHFIDLSHYLRLDRADQWKLDYAKRPTGGGITFHQSDFAFSVFIPAQHPGYHLNILDNYAFINSRIIQALENLLGPGQFSLLPEETSQAGPSQHFCLAKPTQYDVMFHGKKLGGGAQRRTKEGFLHQGSLSLCLPDENFLRDILQPDSNVLECIKKNSYYPFPSNELASARHQIKELLTQEFNN